MYISVVLFLLLYCDYCHFWLHQRRREKEKKASVYMYGLAFGQLASLNAGLVKNDYIAVFLIDCQTLPDGTSCWALPVQVTFSDHDHISRSQQVKHFSWRFYLRIQLSANIVWLLNMPSRSQRYLCFSLLHVFKGDKGCVFKIEKKRKKLWHCLFLRHCIMKSF